MKKPYPLLAGLTALLAAVTAQANCEVPSTLQGRTLVNALDERYSPQNPNASSVLRVEFGNASYKLDVLQSGRVVQGSYRYDALAPNGGQLKMREEFGGQVSDYAVTLVCLNDVSGTLVTTQWQGAIKPDIRQNTGRYNLLK